MSLCALYGGECTAGASPVPRPTCRAASAGSPGAETLAPAVD